MATVSAIVFVSNRFCVIVRPATSQLGSVWLYKLAMATLLLVYSTMCVLRMTELSSDSNIYRAVPGYVSNIKGKYMPSVLRAVLYRIYSDYRYL